MTGKPTKDSTQEPPLPEPRFFGTTMPRNDVAALDPSVAAQMSRFGMHVT